ncbi:hypothetical protein BRARA_D00800 [Brassica rapa]|uniref:Uncharacterized protein n=1 Tax=Brassica campestris TaxID=3711 RepID=A0A397ZRD5_BRACM|nr:hypothetical protein BRARA_D00800 [Brassica rapa]
MEVLGESNALLSSEGVLIQAQDGDSIQAHEGNDGSDLGIRAEKADLVSYAKVVLKYGVSDVSVPEDLMIDVEPLWKSFVVGYFMNDASHIGMIHSTVNRIWSSPGKVSKIDVQFIGKKMKGSSGTSPRFLLSSMSGILNLQRTPPDLSAMPLWVDLENVPGYLYSKKGLSFLSRTAGKFLKLHPNTEQCIRLDVARVLVEVDLGKPLPQKICFKGRDGEDTTVLVHYPWLPPRCGKTSEGNMEGSVEKVLGQRQGKEVVSDLLNELEKSPVIASLSDVVRIASAKDMRLFINNLSSGKETENWIIIGE